MVVETDDTSDRTITDESGNQVFLFGRPGVRPPRDQEVTGSPAEKAGLTGGTLYGIKVDGMPNERTSCALANSTFSLVELSDQSAKSGDQLEVASHSKAVTEFARPEDAAWDPTNPNVLYLNTTNAFDRPSRLWKLTFADPADPSQGGTIEAVLDGTEGQHMIDNLGMNGRGQVVEQEDPGNNAYLAKLRLLRPAQRLAHRGRQARSGPVLVRAARLPDAGRGVIRRDRRVSDPRQGLVPGRRPGALRARLRAGRRRATVCLEDPARPLATGRSGHAIACSA